jgi:ubiquinone biosynthesis monooxygenase Coq7
LRDIDSAAFATISAIVTEEQQHHDRSAAHSQDGSLWPKVLGPVVSASTEAVIWLGMRL